MENKELDRSKFQIIGCEDMDAEAIVRPTMTFFEDAWRRLKLNKIAMISLAMLVIVAVLVIIGPYIPKWVCGINGNENNMDIADQFWSKQHWFGTDSVGRDMFVQLWEGGRVSMAIALLATVIQFTVGCLYGGVSGYFGGLVDDIMMRIVEILNSIPDMIIIILLSIYFGSGIIQLVIAITMVAWVGTARLLRAQVLQLKESEFVLAAQALGADPGRIILKHLIPNSVGLLIVNATMTVPGFIFSEAFLSFIGLGIQPPATSWGAMIANGNSQFTFYPHELVVPAVALCITVLSINLLGDGLNEALDPKMRK